MTQSEDAPAIPLWIAGHAFLTLTPAFQEVRDARSGVLLRRTPLCGVNEVRQAVAAANAALPAWQAHGEATRSALLTQLADALAGYAGHFAQLIAEESGADDECAHAEVAAAVELLRAAPAGQVDGVLAVIGGRQTPLLGIVRLAAPAWRAGAALVVRPDPHCPSPSVALAELMTRGAFPPGVCNVVHGDAAVVGGLRACGIALAVACAETLPIGRDADAEPAR